MKLAKETNLGPQRLSGATMTKHAKYRIIKKLVKINGNKNRAAIELGCNRYHVNRFTGSVLTVGGHT